jgi:hypothetical protein
LNVFVQDGRYGLAHSSRRYQVISLDAYRPPYIPWHLTTREFFQIVRDHLTEDGVVTVNVGRAPNDRRLIEALHATLLTIFPSVHVMDIPGTFNSILYATAQPTTVGDLDANLMLLRSDPAVHPLIRRAVEMAALNLQPPPDPGPVFTDDRAPIEWLTIFCPATRRFCNEIFFFQAYSDVGFPGGAFLPGDDGHPPVDHPAIPGNRIPHALLPPG